MAAYTMNVWTGCVTGSGWKYIVGAQAMHTGGRVMMESASAKVELGELEKKLQQAINELPDQCRAIFCLSRYGELGYKEIAGQLGISVKTVEAQISKALKRLRKKLADFLV
jgi:RNA polymerase sigma-70 factor (ECF subfamily)